MNKIDALSDTTWQSQLTTVIASHKDRCSNCSSLSILSIKNQRFESLSKCMKRKDEIYLDFYKMSGTRVFIKKNLRPPYCVHMTQYWNSCWLEGKQKSNYLKKYLNKENFVNMALFLMCVILNTPAMIRITVRYHPSN